MANRDVKLTLTAQDRASRVVEALRDALKELEGSQEGVENSSKETGSALNRLAGAMRDFEGAARGANGADAFGGDIEDASASVAKLEASVASLQSELEQLRQSQKEATARTKEAEAAVTELSKEYDTQRARLRALQAARTRALNAEQKAMESNSAETRQAAQAAREAEAAVNGQNDAVLTLKGRLDTAKASLKAAQKAQSDLARDARKTGGELKNEKVALEQARAATLALSGAQRQQATASGNAAAGTGRLRDALRQLYGEGRRALSITQRLRGEVLALATSYFGFFAAFQGIGQAINDLQTLEGAQSRLNAVFDGNQTEVAQELDFIRRSANRLGVEFGTMADAYTKFAASTKGTDIEEDTRGIFIATAEAARVNKLSIDQLQGTLVALSQIASKGAVQMEELRQQLGDRLPGAIQILADGLGVSTGELIKMLEQGEVSSEALVNFADELTKRFGGQLPSALQTTTTAIGRLQNSIFQARTNLARAFEDGLRTFLESVSETIGSADFEASLENLGTLVGNVFKVAAAAVENFRTVLTIIVAIISVKLVPLINVMIAGFFNFANALRGQATPSMGNFNKAVVLTTASMRTGSAAATTFTGKLRVLGGALKSILATTGVGLAFVAFTTILTLMSTKADDATEALNRQRKTVDDLRDAHDAGATSVSDYADQIERISKLDAARNLVDIRKEVKGLNQELSTILNRGGNQAGTARGGGIFDRVERGFDRIVNVAGARFTEEQQRQIKIITEGYLEGAKSADEFRNALGALAEQEGFSENETEKLGEFADKAEELKDGLFQLQQAQAIATLKTEDASEAAKQAAIDFLTMDRSTNQLSAGLDVTGDKLDKFTELTNTLKEGIPELKAEMDRLSDLEKLNDALENAGLPQTVEELNALADALDNVFQAQLFGMSLSDIGFDVDQLREIIDLVERRSAEINKPSDKKDPFQTALERTLRAVGDDEIKLVTDALEREGRTIEAERKRRARQFDEFFSGVKIPAGEAARVEELRNKYIGLGDALVSSDQAEDAANAINDLSEAVKKAQRDLAEETATSPEQQRNLFIEGQQEYIDSLFEGIQLQEGDIETKNRLAQQYVTLTTAVYDLNAAEKEREAELKRAGDAESRVNDLVAYRTELFRQLQYAQQTGNGVMEERTREAIIEVNSQITQAIDNAIAMWQAIGGVEADLAVAKLENLKFALEENVKQPILDMTEVGPMLVNGLGNMWGTFVDELARTGDAFASLEDAFKSFAAQFLRQIAQMILQALIFRALSAAFPGLFPAGAAGPGAGGLGAIPAGVNHGGRKGNTPRGRTRQVDASAFIGAPRFHKGRMGLKSNEMAAIIERSEDVVTKDDPRHSSNYGKGGGGGAGPMIDQKIVNVIDGKDVMEAALADAPGQEVFLNFMRKNSRAVKSSLGIGEGKK